MPKTGIQGLAETLIQPKYVNRNQKFKSKYKTIYPEKQKDQKVELYREKRNYHD